MGAELETAIPKWTNRTLARDIEFVLPSSVVLGDSKTGFLNEILSRR